MQAVIAYGDDLGIIPDVWVRGTVLSRSGLELRWESKELPYKLRDFLTDSAADAWLVSSVKLWWRMP